MKKNILFIINPISGGISKHLIPALIEKHLDHQKYQAEIKFTSKAEDTADFAREAVLAKKNVVVAVGGDGTINQVASQLIHTETSLGIIPKGSGNGFARHLRIPLNTLGAIQLLNKGVKKTIDCASFNKECFVNVAGVGFDAFVAWKFATAPKRGFYSYAKITLGEFSRYKARKYELEIDGVPYSREAFLITFSNGDQYGNNAFIAPGADMQDGVLDVAILKNVSFRTLPRLAYELFTQRFNRSRDVEIIRGKHIKVIRPKAEVVNIDGEPVEMEKDAEVMIQPASLRVICSP